MEFDRPVRSNWENSNVDVKPAIDCHKLRGLKYYEMKEHKNSHTLAFSIQGQMAQAALA